MSALMACKQHSKTLIVLTFLSIVYRKVADAMKECFNISDTVDEAEHTNDTVHKSIL